MHAVKFFILPADGSLSPLPLVVLIKPYPPAGGAELHYLQNRSEVRSVVIQEQVVRYFGSYLVASVITQGLVILW